jgi:predicted dehydrogenase
MKTRSNRDGGRPRDVRVGVLGLGYWGPNLVRNLAELPGVELAGLCDVRPSVLDTISRRYPGVPCFVSADDLLGDASLDAVLIATPVSTHHDLAKRALTAGKHVFVEKPLAASTDDAHELISLASERGLVLMPGHTFLYSPPVTMIKGLIDAGELGDI